MRQYPGSSMLAITRSRAPQRQQLSISGNYRVEVMLDGKSAELKS